MNTAILASLLLAADAGGAAGVCGRPIGIAGVPDSGLSGIVTRQSIVGSEVVLLLEGVEVRITRWPDPGHPPALEGMLLVATTRIHPEGPSNRLELGPEKGGALWVLGSMARVQAPLVAGATLGRAAVRNGSVPRVPILQAGKEVARLKPGETKVLRGAEGRWCLGIAAISMPGTPTPGIAGEVHAPRVDFFARRLPGKARSCAPPASG